MPTQLTIRADEELVARVKAAAQRRGRSMNEHVVAVLDAATNPELAGDEAERLRERLRLAGVVADLAPRSGPRPAADRVAKARRRAGRGTPLARLVTDSR